MKRKETVTNKKHENISSKQEIFVYTRVEVFLSKIKYLQPQETLNLKTYMLLDNVPQW
jgi:hypothetical protein